MACKIIDFHTHAFPDSIAGRAMKTLLAEAEGAKAYLDGTLSALLKSMDDNGIEKSVLCNIATKPSQFEPILKWAKQVSSERIIPLPSVHPDDPNLLQNLDLVKSEGFLGIKLHPYYQDFILDDSGMYKLYEKCEKLSLFVIVHTGFDIAFERIRKADPKKILKMTHDFPDLTLISTHFGAWEDWDDVERYLIGKPIFMEISFALEYLSPEQARRMLLNHNSDFLLFGTDSPWSSQQHTLRLLNDLKLPEELLRKILYKNSARILHLDEHDFQY